MDIPKKRAKKPKLKPIQFDHLLEEAQFHGSNRIASKKYRLLWCFTLAIMLWASLSILAHTVIRFIEQPTFMALKGFQKQHVNFPSLAICPELSYSDYKMDAFVKEINYPPGVNVTNFRKNLRQLAAFYSPDVTYNIEDLEMLQTVLAFNNLDVEVTGQQLTPTCEEAVLREMADNITLRHPYYTNFDGPMSELMTVVNTSQEHSSVDLTYKWVIIEGGQYYAEAMMNGTPLAAGKELWLGYAWTLFSINDEARNLQQNLRQCRLSTEVLDYFPVYGRWYCHVECEMARTLRLCQCVRVTHPQPPGARICDASKLNCTRRAAVVYGSTYCTCPQTCDDHVSYYKVQTYDLNNKEYFDFFYDGLDFRKVSVVRAYILTANLKEYTRIAYFDKVNLFSQLGGIVNVFFGCSILSLLEVIQILWYAIKNRYYSHQVKIQQTPPDKPNLKASRNKNKKQKTVKFAKNQKQTKNDRHLVNNSSNINILPILVLLPQLVNRKNN